jgi:predicted DNA-binding transcriptional regulator AlpA
MTRADNSRVSKPLLSVEDTAILLGQSRSSIYRAIERGDLPLPVFTINGRLRIARRSVERLISGDLPLTAHADLVTEADHCGNQTLTTCSTPGKASGQLSVR